MRKAFKLISFPDAAEGFARRELKRNAIDPAGRIADHGRNHISVRGNSYARRIGVRGEVAARVWRATKRSAARAAGSTITLRCRRAAGFFVPDEKDSRRNLDLRADP